MRRVSVALVALAAALVLTAAPALAQPASRSFDVSPRIVLADQRVTASGQGCDRRAFVNIYLDGVQIARARADTQGRFVKSVRLPSWLDPGRHRMRAECSSRQIGSVALRVLRPRFSVSPRAVEAGDFITVSGSACPARSRVIIELDDRRLTSVRADQQGNFSKRARIPRRTSPTRHVVSVSCGGRFIGSRSIRVLQVYPAAADTLNVSQSVVEAGRTVAVKGSDCPTRAPVASLDGQPIAVNVDQNSKVKGKGFSGTVTIPRETVPGRHSLWAACDAGSAGTTELNVLDPANTESAVSRQAFDPKPVSNLAIWAGLLAGVALLMASARIGGRRRRS